jgi:predicted DNA-binding mobile mystery protein A
MPSPCGFGVLPQPSTRGFANEQPAHCGQAKNSQEHGIYPTCSQTMGIQRRITRGRIDADLSLLNRPRYHPTGGWVKTIRESLGMSELELSARLGVTQQRVSQLQSAEAKESIQLSTLRRAAEALNCELVYYLAPKEALGNMVWRQAFAKAAEEVGYDPDDPDDDDRAVRKGEEAEALTPCWVDRRGLWRQGPATGSTFEAGQPPVSAAPAPPAPSLEPWPGLP